MPPKRRCAIVFIHGLARKPPEDKLLELWHMGLDRDKPRPPMFDSPGLKISTKAVTALNYYADVFYGKDYETDIQSYYEGDSGSEAELAATASEPGPPLPPTVTAEEA